MLSKCATSASRRGFVTATAAAAQKSYVAQILGNMSSPGAMMPMTDEYSYDRAGGFAPDAATALPAPEITTLGSGVRVVTQETFQEASSLGIFVNAGSRNETASNMGLTHLLEKMAFQSSNEFSKERIMYEIEMLGARDNIFANRSRETMIYGADVLRENSADMLTILMECIFNSKYDAEELEAQKQIVMDVDTKQLQEDPTSQVFEAFHRAAYGDSTLGLPMFARPQELAGLSSASLFDFKDTHFTGDNIVLAGASCDHALLVSFAESYLGGVAPKSAAPASAAAYSGGEQFIPGYGDETHMAVGFQGVGYNHEDMIYYHALHMMLGGGSSFSAGGPGKGLYSRLYTNVLNRNHWVNNATAFNVQYADTGFFGITGAAHKDDMMHMSEVLCVQLKQMASQPAGAEEMGRVKNMLKSYMLMNFESRAIVMEDVGRQILASNKHVSPATLCAQVDAMQPEDLQRVAKTMLATPVTLSGHGDTSKIAPLAAIAREFSA